MMAFLGFLVLLAFLVLPFVALFWAYENGKRLERLSADMTRWMQRLEGHMTGGAPAAPVRAASTAAPAAGSASAPAAPAEAAFTDIPAAAPVQPAPVQPQPTVPPAAPAQPARRDDIFKDESLFTDASGEQWVEFSDAPAAQTTYFEDTAQKPAAATAASSPWGAAGTAPAKSPAPA